MNGSSKSANRAASSARILTASGKVCQGASSSSSLDGASSWESSASRYQTKPLPTSCVRSAGVPPFSKNSATVVADL